MTRYIGVVAKTDKSEWNWVYGILDTQSGKIASFIERDNVAGLCEALEQGKSIDLDWNIPGNWFYNRVWTLLDGNPLPGADGYIPGKFGTILGS